MVIDCPRKEKLSSLICEVGKEQEEDTLRCNSMQVIQALECGKKKLTSVIDYQVDLTIDVLVDGMRVSALVDTGVVESIISYEESITLGLKIRRKEERSLVVVNGEHM